MLLFGSVFGTQGSGPKVLYYSDRELYMDNNSWTKIDKEPASLEEIKNMKSDILIVAKNGKIDVYYLTTISQSNPEIIEILGSKTPHFNARIQSRFVN